MKKNGKNGRAPREEHQVDDWLMTYADMITLLLCFFAIFLSVSVPKQEQFQEVRARVMGQFAAPDRPIGSALPTATQPEGEAPPVEQSPFSTPRTSHGVPEDETPLDGMDSIIDAPYIQSDPNENDAKKDARDRISSIDMDSASFFAVGSAELSAAGKGILDTVVETVNGPEYRDYQVTVEGHTDDSPISTPQFPSNWELSTARAAAVARYFLERGVQAQRLRASGYADTFPKAPNRDAAGVPIPGNRAQNRRVVIRLEKIEKAEKTEKDTLP